MIGTPRAKPFREHAAPLDLKDINDSSKTQMTAIGSHNKHYFSFRHGELAYQPVVMIAPA